MFTKFGVNKFDCAEKCNKKINCSFQLQSFGDWEGVASEVDEAARAVRQLGTLLFEMEILRTYLEQQDLQFFDSILEPAKTTAFIAVQGLVGECNAM